MGVKLTILLFYVIFGTFVRKARCQNTFAAVSTFQKLDQLYMKIRAKEKHIAPDTTTDVETKKRICQSVTTSAFFDLHYEENFVDMDAIYDKLKDRAKRERDGPYPDISFKKVLHAYERDELSRSMFYTYRGALIVVEGIGDEFAFACVTKKRKNGVIHLYYVSDAYNINAATDAATEDGQIGARFVCYAMLKKCRLVAMAEEPATVFSSSEYTIESIYLRMRRSYFAASVPSEDPLCRLSRPEKLRVCASVLSSSYFVDRVKFLPDERALKEKCELNTVSFRVDEVKKAAEDHIYKEWMLSCRVQQTADRAPLTYFISRAYHPHHVFVYSRHLYAWKWVWYIENISAKISVIIEKGEMMTKDAGGEDPPPNLINLQMNIL